MFNVIAHYIVNATEKKTLIFIVVLRKQSKNQCSIFLYSRMTSCLIFNPVIFQTTHKTAKTSNYAWYLNTTM